MDVDSMHTWFLIFHSIIGLISIDVDMHGTPTWYHPCFRVLLLKGFLCYWLEFDSAKLVLVDSCRLWIELDSKDGWLVDSICRDNTRNMMEAAIGSEPSLFSCWLLLEWKRLYIGYVCNRIHDALCALNPFSKGHIDCVRLISRLHSALHNRDVWSFARFVG